MNKKKQIIWISCIAVFLFLFLWKFGGINVFYNVGNVNGYMTTVGKQNAKEILDMKQGDVYQQTLVGTRDEIVGFTVRFGTYGQQVKGKLKVTFSDISGKNVYFNKTLDCKKIIDNEYHLFLLDEVITDGREKEYRITIETVSLKENQKLALFLAEDDLYKAGSFIQNDRELKDMDMTCQLAGTAGFLKKWYILGAAVILLGFLVFSYVTFIKKCKLEYVYLTLGITFGMIFILCFPPYTTPDEMSHISLSYAYASSLLGEKPVISEDNKVILRGTDTDVSASTEVSLSKFHNLYDAIKYPSGDFERNAVGGGKVDIPFTSYLPQIFGVALGMIFKLSGFWTLYLGKLFAMFFFTGCIFFSIKIIPWGKMVIMTLALLPMTMELATSFSHDCVLIGLCTVFISYAMHLIYVKKEVTWRDVVFLGVLIAVISPGKLFYFLIAGMLYLIPKEKYKSTKAYWLINTGILLAGMGMLIVIRFRFLAGHIGQTTQSVLDPSTVNYSISYILGNIPNSITVLFNTFMGKSDFYFTTLLGSQLGWFQVAIPTTVTTGFLLVLLVAGVCHVRGEKAEYMPDMKFRIISLGFSFLMFMGVLAALWIGWTPITTGCIEGVQGRYMLPFFPMVVLAMKNRVFLLNKNVDRCLCSILFGLLTFTFLYVVPYITR